ncbi:MAG: PTS sugar transporter subunit IIA [Opitutae bacterium]|nr:PTS sugar transporter subunit IIA [Opitutae bacterium]
MPHRIFNCDEVAAYLHLPRADIERFAKGGEIPCERRGGRLVFQRSEIDAWASQRILGLPQNRLADYHQKATRATQAALAKDALVAELLPSDYIEPALTAKTRASVLREMVALADRTGLVLDARDLQASVEAREALCATAVPGGLALLHARHQQPYRFEGSFLVLGRTLQGIHFSAPDGQPTRLFFLICCQDDRLHLHTLARLCLLAVKTELIAQLLAAPGRDAMHAALVAAEAAVLAGKKAAPAD